ncbi:MAG: lamin tail domain-containing protein, partial [Bacteroidota bacterium]|nr:lamin tail domain-containing protein [Bacteroidota bacterium]
MRYTYYTILFALFTYQAQSQVIINEISYNPPESGTDSLEYIEIFNAGAQQVDLTGWYFDGVEDTLPTIQLLPGDFFVTAVRASAMFNVFGISNVHEWSAGGLNNSGELLVLYDAGGNVVDSVRFADGDPWPTEPDGNGPSLELSDPASDNNDGANWHFSGNGTGIIINGNEVFGTPGAVNSDGGTTGPAVTVTMANLQFEPPHIVIAIGDSVRWVNNEQDFHNVNGSKATYPNNPDDFFSGFPEGGPWQYDFT